MRRSAYFYGAARDIALGTHFTGFFFGHCVLYKPTLSEPYSILQRISRIVELNLELAEETNALPFCRIIDLSYGQPRDPIKLLLVWHPFTGATFQCRLK